jgi:hydrogenase expression/formation protein HypD
VKYLAEFRDGSLAAGLLDRIHRRPPVPTTIMEVCGTHTVALFRHGIPQLLPEHVTLVSGPGCPVCVTDNRDIDWAIALARQPGVLLLTFGDMMRVPGSSASLQQARAEGCDIRPVYSALDCLDIARANPGRPVVFLGVGFETTAPTIACAIVEAERLGIRNFHVFSAHKVMPPALDALASAGEIRIDGLICPGHVSAVIGSRPYRFLPERYGISCVIAGFEPLDMLQAIDMLLVQKLEGRSAVEIQYRRVVREDGNPVAREMMRRVFEPVDAGWRGLGSIPASGLTIREEYGRFDARLAFPLDPVQTTEHRGCRCGEVLRGVARPPDCALYGMACTPDKPIGPCMVSSEGTCAAWFQYAEVQ